MRKFLVLAIAGTLAACGEAGDETTEAAVTYPGVPEEQAAQIRASGKVKDPASFDIFAPLVDAPPYDDVTMTTDIAYGDDPLQQLDVYTFNEATEGESRPVLLYVHGGAFVGGSKQSAYYPQSATAWAARNGMVGVNINYRLAPDNTWPAARNDLASAIAWVRGNIAEYGGNPDHIVLWGHSAGANHVADYTVHRDLQGEEAASVKGALLLSPNYTAETGQDPHIYYGTQEELRGASAAIARIGASDIPIMIGWAEYDPDLFHDFAAETQSTLCSEASEANCPTLLLLKDHDHMTEGASIGSVDQSLSGPFLDWMAGL